MSEKEGLKLKYLLSKADGYPVDPDGDYFILKLNSKTRWHRVASIKAILAYAESVKNDAPQLAADIKAKYGCASHTPAPTEQDTREKVLKEVIEFLELKGRQPVTGYWYSAAAETIKSKFTKQGEP